MSNGDGTDVNIHLKTTGDTSGAEEVKESVFGAVDAAKEAQMQADVDAVKAKQAAEVQREQAAALREVVDAQQRLVAANLAQALNRISGEFKGISAETDMAITAGENFLNVLATTGNPIAASLALIGTALNGVMDAYRKADEQAKQLAKDEEAHLKNISELRALYYQQIRTENLVSFFNKELDSLDAQEKALKRISQIRASERALAAAEQQAASAAGVRGGDDPQFAAARDAVTATQQQIAEVNAKLQEQREAVAIAQEKANTLALEAKALNEQQGEGGQEAVAAAKAAEQAAKAAEETKLDLAASVEVSQNEIQAIIAAGSEKITASASQAFEAASTKNAEELRSVIDGIKTAQNGILSEPVKRVNEGLAVLLADGKIIADEVALFTNLTLQFKTSREAATQQMQGYLQWLVTDERSMVAKMNGFDGQLRQLRFEIERINTTPR